jgi:PAS domain S-box-containing protein
MRGRLSAADARFRAVFNSLQEGVVTIDSSGEVLDWNPAALELHGYATVEEAHKQLAEYPKVFELETLDGKPLSFERWPTARVLRGEEFCAWELRVRRKETGVDKIFSYSGIPLKEGGQVTLAVLTIKDVTEQFQAEQELKKREADLRDFVENASVGLHWVGPDGTVLWANDTELKMLGYTREEYIGRNISDFHADEPVINDILSCLTRGETLHNREARLRCKDGSIRYVIINSNVRFEDGKFVHTRCFTRDVTDKKVTEQALVETAERFQALADNIDQLAWMADSEGWIYWYNRRWYEYTGTTPEQMEGWGWQKVHDPEELPRVLNRWTESIKTGEPFDMEFPIKGADGVFRPFLTRVHPVLDKDRRVVRWCGTNTDISEQKATQERLHVLTENLDQLVKERTEELLQANEQLQGFTYSVAHDFRSQIRGVTANAAMLLEDAGDQLNEENREHLEFLVASAKKMSSLTEDLLLYSRLGKDHLRMMDVDVSQIAQELLPSLEAKSYFNPNTEIVIQPDLHVQGDPGQISLLVENLLDNACKYSSNVQVPRVELGKDEQGFYVRDNGAGFDMQFVGKLFKPFERLHSEEYEGTGIGLANVARIVTRHGGHASAESELGKGATFRFSLGR